MLNISARILRRFLKSASATAFVVAVSGACSNDAPLEAERSSGSRESKEIHRELDFSDYLSQARILVPYTSLDLSSPAHRRFLSSGWNAVEFDSNSSTSVTSKGALAVLNVPSLRSESLRISFDVSVPAKGRAEDRLLQVRWNGAVIQPESIDKASGSAPAEEETLLSLAPVRVTTETMQVSYRIPEEQVRVGDNYLEFESSVWETVPDSARPGDLVEVALKFSRFEIEHDLKAGGLSVPADSPVVPKESNFYQAPGSLLAFYFSVHQRAQFEAAVSLDLEEGESTPTPGAFVRLVARGEGGEEAVLLRTSLETLVAGDPMPVAADLNSFEGQSVAFYFAVDPVSSSANEIDSVPFQVEWMSPTLHESIAVADSEIAVPYETAPYNILVVLFDSLRADATGPYGGAAKTPELDELSQRGVVFSSAFSTSSETSPSIVSILTSQYVHEHRYERLGGAVRDDLPYLPQVLQEAGYATLAIFGNPRMTPEWGGQGFDRGFDKTVSTFRLKTETSRSPGITTPEAHVREVWEQSIRPTVNNPEGKPFFIFLHEFDPHAPYDPPKPYDSMYGTGDGRRLFAGVRGIEPLVLTHQNRMPLDGGQVDEIEGLYRGEVSYMDAYLGELLNRLRESGIERDTLVVFLSDHGEEFMDHDMLGHGVHLWETLLHVPLIVSLPGQLPEGTRIDRPTSLAELPGLILDLVGVPVPEGMRQSVTAADLFDPGSISDLHASYARIRYEPDEPHRAMARDSIRAGSWKLIRERSMASSNEPERYILTRWDEDPGESLNWWPSRPIVGHALRQRLEHAEATGGVGLSDGSITTDDGGGMSEETLERLRDLGYLGN